MFLLEQAVQNVRLRAPFLTIATSPRHVFAYARGPRFARDPRSSRETLCTGDAPVPHGKAAAIETVPSAFKCMPGTPGHGLTGLSRAATAAARDASHSPYQVHWSAGSYCQTLPAWAHSQAAQGALPVSMPAALTGPTPSPTCFLHRAHSRYLYNYA